MKRIAEENINTQQYWDTVYNRELNRDKIRRNSQLFTLVAEYAQGTVLDIGCGSGALVESLIDRRIEAIGFDISKYAVEFGQNYRSTLKGKLKVVDVSKGLKLEDGAVGTCVSLQTLEHLDDPEFVVSEMKRVSKNRVIISVPNADRIKDKEHVWEFAEDDLKKLLGVCRVIEVSNGLRLFAYTID